jgi:mono/diheme cytochrome c family protein
MGTEVRPENALWACFFRNVVLLGVLVCLGAGGCRKSTANYAIPPEESSRPNPFTLTPENIDAGKKVYDGTDCALCHGAAGDGQGSLTRDMKYDTHNWQTSAVLSRFSDGELFYILSKGKGAMPGYEDRNSAEELWQIVCYLRSFARPYFLLQR